MRLTLPTWQLEKWRSVLTHSRAAEKEHNREVANIA
jgi:hypothetical protein